MLRMTRIEHALVENVSGLSGDVKTERWTMVSEKEIQKLPTFQFDPSALAAAVGDGCRLWLRHYAIAPGSGNQWSAFADLPEGRGGGGLVYDSNSNSLIFSAGAETQGCVGGGTAEKQYA